MTGAIADYSLPEELTPEWISTHHPRLKKILQKSDLKVNCSSLKILNSLGLIFLAELHQLSQKSKTKLVLSQVPGTLKAELEKVHQPAGPRIQPDLKKDSVFYRTGDGILLISRQVADILHLFTESLYWSTFGILKRKTVLEGSAFTQMVLLGSSSLPIVMLLSFLIGLTLAIQSAVQLEKFGASLYIASGIGISMVTEIGPMLTSVIIAGRSGSAITAEISTMVVQEEVRALQTMAVNPIHFLLLPRFWALSLTLPLLVICADIIGVFSGLLIAVFYADVPVQLFFNELSGAVSATMLIQSMIKTITFSWLITLIATYKGFNARGGADAVGKATTSCVVTCIFCIILADAIFSFIFYF